jgi:hypothetical protein
MGRKKLKSYEFYLRIKTVRNLFLFFLGTTLLATTVVAKEPLRTQDSVIVKGGKISQTSIISDPNGEIFLEFLKDMRVINSSDRTSFEGEILPPALISLPDRAPRPRMQEILTFELLADTAERILFTDKFSLLQRASIARMQLTDPDNFQRTSLVKVFAPIKNQQNVLALWEYKGNDEGWARLGGSAEVSSDPDVLVFSSSIKSTGIFTIFEENPPPSYVPPFPIDQIELVESPPELEMEESQESDILVPNEVGVETDIFPIPEESPTETIPSVVFEEEIPIPASVTEKTKTENSSHEEIDETSNISDNPEPKRELSGEKEEILPPSPLLSKTGPEEEVHKKSFPFGIVFSLIIIIASGFMAFGQKKE